MTADKVLVCLDCFGPKCFDLRAEECVFYRCELGICAQDEFRFGLRFQQELCVSQFGDFEVGDAALAGAKKLTGAP